ncbi:peptidoglycan-binding protein [Streptomyces sp. NBC_00439]|uniref:peptidoglycan-binding protein n=1 Tax=Streptomyces sp. NBC_00439 TaxID=2903650 RepID=UPI002258373D|nr:peptidoglycan-binding protein [Streptomyces sp. NBC_00439]MCX5106998.1 peptidoglycan-binding protein [Streptomyces sp. NBC_00439]
MRPEQGDMPPAQPLPEVTALLQALRQVKESKNLSLDAFTHDTGYSRSSWNRVLKGTAFPPRAAVERLCTRRGLDKNTLLGLWDTADQARRAADTQEAADAQGEAPSEAESLPALAAPAQGVPDPVPPTTPGPVPPTAAPDPLPTAAADPAPGATAPKPAAASPDSAPSTPGPVEPAEPAAAPRKPSTSSPAKPVKPAAAPRSRIKILALTAAALAALLLVGRWYSTYEENPTTIEVSDDNRPGDNRPGDDQPVVDETPLPPKSSTAPTKTPTDGEKKKDKDQDSTGEEDTNTTSPRPSSSAKDQASSPVSASASPSTAASPGAAGRANCGHNSDRTQVMAKGMVGSKVRQIQCLLNSNYDYTLTVDGKFGDSTDVAVRAVQRCSGLNPDGQVGPQTWKYLDTPMSGCGH